jgi:hypothetical protein
MSNTQARQAATSVILEALDTFLITQVQTDPNMTIERSPGTAWARIIYKDGAHNVAGVGAGRPLLRGPVIVFVDIFVPLNSGDGLAVDACEAVRDAMITFQSNGLRFERFESGVEGLVDGQYQKQQIVVLNHRTRG